MMNNLCGSRTHFAVVVLCLALSFALGVSNLKSSPMAIDEPWSARNISKSRFDPPYSISETIEIALRGDVHAPGYFILLNIWGRLSSLDLFSYRLLSVYFGLFAVALTYRLALLAGDADTAIDAALLSACLAFVVYYTYHTRMYSLMTLMSVWVAWCYWKIVSAAGPVPRRYWIAFILVSVATMWVHAFDVFMLVAVGIYHLFFAPKNRRWLHICLAAMAAGLLLALWLPYNTQAFAARIVPSSDTLSPVDSMLAFASIYTNGLPLLVPVVAIAAALNYRRLSQSQIYIMILAVTIALLMLVANEFAPVVVARRIRYTIVIALPLCCALAIGLNLIPAWRYFRIPFMLLWVAAFAAYSRSDEMLLYTNWLDLDQHKVPHYQDVFYEAEVVTSGTDVIVSFHPDTPIPSRYLGYYGKVPGKVQGLIHIWTNDVGEAEMKSLDPKLASLDNMASWRFPAWLVYNPQQTDLSSIPAYTDGFAKHYHACGRYVEKPLSVVERYAPKDVPCALITAAAPLAIQYDNGTELGNIIYKLETDSLQVHTWWTRTDFGVFKYTLQVFAADGTKAGPQTDDLIGNSGFYMQRLDISSLTAGEYVLKLIVYERASLKSQPGLVTEPSRQFQRDVEVARFIIGD